MYHLKFPYELIHIHAFVKTDQGFDLVANFTLFCSFEPECRLPTLEYFTACFVVMFKSKLLYHTFHLNFGYYTSTQLYRNGHECSGTHQKLFCLSESNLTGTFFQSEDGFGRFYFEAVTTLTVDNGPAHYSSADMETQKNVSELTPSSSFSSFSFSFTLA